MKKYKYYLLGLFFIVLGFIIIFLLNNKEVINLDLQIYNSITSKRTNDLSNLMKIISYFSSCVFLIIFAFILMLLFKEKRKLISYNLIGIFILNRFIKLLVSRERPNGLKLIKASGFSFPSAHAMIGTCFYSLLIYLIIKSNLNKKNKVILSIFIIILIILVSYSRVYLGVHYPLDVIGGILFSLGYLIVFIKIYNNNSIN